MARVLLRASDWLTLLLLGALASPLTSEVKAGTVLLVHPGGYRGELQNVAPIRRRRADDEERSPALPVIQQLHITSNITARFGVTELNSVMTNGNDQDLEVKFQMQLPLEAFISNFTMLIDDELYVGDVLEKQEAREAYEDARDQNQTAAMVSSATTPDLLKRRGMELFEVSINLAAGGQGVFCLLYQQLLRRRLGVFTHTINIDTPSLVKDLQVRVAVYEPQGFIFFDVEEPGSNRVVPQDTNIVLEGDLVRIAVYRPSEERQSEMNTSLGGLSGEFVVHYDTEHELGPGLVFIDEDYFIHYFSPNGLQPLPKNVVFVIDISGSMGGLKIDHTKRALLSMLEQLRPFDYFEILFFNNKIRYWHPDGRLVLADVGNVRDARYFVLEHLTVGGTTNINDALVRACRLLADVGQKGQNLVFFLTDGLPTSGVVEPDSIVSNVKHEAAGKASVFSLGFGQDLDFDLLKRISYETGGWAEAIYTGSDSDRQLGDVYQQVDTPLLYDVRMVYDAAVVDMDTVTQRDFYTYFNGSELVVAGRLHGSMTANWLVEVVSTTGNEDMTFTKQVSDLDISVPLGAQEFYPEGFTEKLWATARIRYLLEQHLILTGPAKQRAHTEALDMALRYNLVTPITSMVITQDQKSEGLDFVPLVSPSQSKVYSGGVRFAQFDFKTTIVLYLVLCTFSV